ncbi:MAG: peptidoglycan -binding protein, partial [Steroidobacteraceae bacterium]
MALSSRRRRGHGDSVEAWPGYVDAMSTLLMVIIFVLLVFVLAQAFMSFALNGRTKELESVNHKLADVGKMLSLEQSKSGQLQNAVSVLTAQLADSVHKRQSLSSQLATLTTQLGAAQAEAASNGKKASSLSAQLTNTQQLLADMKKAQAALNKTVTADKATIQLKLADIAKLDEETQALAALRDQLE